MTRTLAVRQPWATYIAEGVKTVEVRTWRTAYRGLLLIAASGRPVRHADEAGAVWVLPTQVQVCTVELIDVRPMVPADIEAACVPWEPGEVEGCFAWVLGSPRHVVPQAHRGRLMLYETADAVRWLPPDGHYLDAMGP